MKLRASLALYVCFLAFAPIAELIDPSFPKELVLPFWAGALWGVPLILFAFIQSPFNRIVGHAWIIWALVGSINVIASYLFYGDFYLLDVAEADLIYILFTSAFFTGILVQERLASRPAESISSAPTDALHPWFVVALVAFPFIWFASVYRALGYIPIMLGVDIGDDMYELDYGPLYGLTLLIALSMLVALECSRAATSARARWAFRLLIIVFGACSMFDSKRVTLMVVLVAFFVYFIRVNGTRFLRSAALVLLLGAGTLAYVGGQVIRKGLDMEILESTELQFSTVGVEFRGFAYTVNNFEPGSIPNYDWALSAGASMINSSLLDAMGIDKQALVEMGSAYAWKNLLDSDFGIRTGIVSELYFAYGYLGLVIVFLFGVLSAWVSARLAHVQTKTGLLFLSAVYGLLLLSIVGQTMSTTGSLTLLLYAWVASSLLQSLVPRARASAPAA